MSSVTLEEAQSRLPELIANLTPGEELIITRDSEPVAKLTGQPTTSRPPRKLGTLKGTITYMAPDFDEPLDDFKEYME